MLTKEEFARIYRRHAPLVRNTLERHDLEPETRADRTQAEIAEIAQTAPLHVFLAAPPRLDEPQS